MRLIPSCSCLKKYKTGSSLVSTHCTEYYSLCMIQATFIYQIITARIRSLFILYILLSILRGIMSMRSNSKPRVLCLCKAPGKEIFSFSSLVDHKTNTVKTSDTDSHCSSSGRKEPSCASFLPCYPDQSRRQVGQGATALHCDTNPQSHYIPRLKPITDTDC